MEWMVCDEQGCALLTPGGKQRVVTLCGLWSMAMRAWHHWRQLIKQHAHRHSMLQPCRRERASAAHSNETVGSPFSLALCLSGLTLAQHGLETAQCRCVAVAVHVVAGIAPSGLMQKMFEQTVFLTSLRGWLLQRGVS
jgi:hypothetical protein